MMTANRTEYDGVEKQEKFHTPCLINKSEVRKLALRWCTAHRKGWDATRVSAAFLDDVESKLRTLITKAVERHRSVGKTITDFL